MRRISIYIALSVLVAGFFTGILYERYIAQKETRDFFSRLTPLRNKADSYPYIYPLLDFRVPESDSLSQYKKLKKNIQNSIAENAAPSDLVSVYFRDSMYGRVVSINEDEAYYPGSLLKTVIMIAYLKIAETDPGILEKYLVYQGNIVTDTQAQPFSALSSLKQGQAYTVGELIEHMIADSDNGARDLLISRLDLTYLGTVFAELGIPGADEDGEYHVSAREYSVVFRVLYNGTYLNHAMSNKALEILSKATFTDGLKSGVPIDTAVAHKFGERVVTAGGQQFIELHDCGIVYYSNRNYFLCVMTHTESYEKGAGLIEEISRVVYQTIKEDMQESSP